MSVLDRIREDVQQRVNGTDRSASGLLDGIPDFDGTHGFVRHTPELDRILALPRHDWKNRDDLDDLVDFVTDHLKKPEGTMRLRTVQAVGIEQLCHADGLFASIAVGEGKTLISFLAAVALDIEVAVVLVPAKLKQKTERDFAELSKHWKGPKKIHVVSYELLGRHQSADLLEKLNPGIIIADECHKLKNLQAAVTRRVVRYLRENRSTRFVAMSGTMTSRSLRDFHHLLAVSIGTETMPLPVTQSETHTWARAVDEKVEVRARPGALGHLLESGQDATVENLRRAVGRRVYETPGVVHTQTSSVSASIQLDYFHPKLPAVVRDHLTILANDKIAPNGDECLPVDVWRIARQLVSGFYYEWDPTPPQEWLNARKAWKRYVRRILEDEDPRYDSEFQVWNACERGSLHGGRAYCDWVRCKSDFQINAVPRWLHDGVLDQIIHATRRRKDVLYWVEHRAVGERLSQLSGLPYFANQGLDSAGNFIDDHTGSAILSIAANCEGRNLQRWNDNFVVTPPGSGRIWEQMLGRTHRSGQLADEVIVTVGIGHSLVAASMEQAFADARYVQDSTGNPQKLLLADLA